MADEDRLIPLNLVMGGGVKDDEPKEGKDLEVLVSELNAKALAASLDALHEKVAAMEVRLVALSAGLANANSNIQKQSQFIGGFVQRVGGTGSTEPDPEG